MVHAVIVIAAAVVCESVEIGRQRRDGAGRVENDFRRPAVGGRSDLNMQSFGKLGDKHRRRTRRIGRTFADRISGICSVIATRVSSATRAANVVYVAGS